MAGTITTDIYAETLLKYGRDRQIDKLIEEMAELTQALLKYKHGEPHNVPEELADVQIVMRQLLPLFPENKEWIENKLKKLVDR